MASIIFFIALGIFAFALYLDTTDPKRQTVRTDYAFWLHLFVAPFLIIASLVMFRSFFGIVSLTFSYQLTDLYISTSLLLIFILTSILIDRRSLLTSSIITLASIIGFVLDGNIFMGGNFYGTLLVLGAILLVLGLSWHAIRRAMINLLPSKWRLFLPPSL